MRISATFCFIFLFAIGLQEVYSAGKVKGKTCGPEQNVAAPLYRYYNTKNGDHFYTTNWNELEGGKGDYKYEGVQAYIFPNAETNTVALHRYFNGGNGDHFYTTNWSELGGGKGRYVYEGIAGYVYPNAVSGTIPLFRYYNGGNGDHFYTTNWDELGGGRGGYVHEGIACYVCN